MLELIDGRDQLTPVYIARPKAAPGPGGRGIDEHVRGIVDDVRLRGDDALLEYTERFDGARLAREDLIVDELTITNARKLVRPELIDALEVMTERLRRTCERQRIDTWLEPYPVTPPDPTGFLRTVCLGPHLEQLPEALR